MSAVCTWCGTDEYIDDEDQTLGMTLCLGPAHGEPRMFEPGLEPRKHAGTSAWAAFRPGIADGLGLHEDLRALLQAGEWADTYVVEYRYGLEHPDTYRWMLDRWGHVEISPRRYSVTTFIGSTLGHLSRQSDVTYRPGRGTGCFAYTPQIGLWSIAPTGADEREVTWAAFAAAEGLDPMRWPLVEPSERRD